MELPWQTNWTQKMKTNATANRLLNTPIGESSFFSPPDIGEPQVMIKLGQFGGMIQKKNDNEEDESKAMFEEEPSFTNVQYLNTTLRQYTSEKSKFDSMIKPEEVTKSTDPQGIVLLDIKFGKHYEREESDFHSIMNNTYVSDYIHINHPSIRQDWVSQWTNKPLVIKPPPHFFSQ